MIDQDFFDEDQSDGSFFFPDGIARKNILSTIEYSDYSVSQALHAIIEDWVAALPKREVPGLLRSLPRAIRSFRGALPALACAFGSIPFLRYAEPQSIAESFQLLLVYAVSTILIYGFAKWGVSSALDALVKLQPTTYLLITTGDKNRKDKIEGESRRRSVTFWFLLTAGLFGFFVGTCSSLFASFLSNL